MNFLQRLLKYTFFLICGYSQAQVYNFEHITDKDGLTNNSVTSIIKDSDGFMWFGTMNGLCRYDGYSFKQFMHDPGNTQSIKENNIRCIVESKKGPIYIGFRSHAFSVYHRETEIFENFEVVNDSTDRLSRNSVLAILEDKVGNIWIGTRTGLDKFDLKTKKFTHYYPFSTQKGGFVSSISEDDAGYLWLYGMGTSICKFDPKRGTYNYIKFTDNIGLNNVVTIGQVNYYKQQVWIGNELDGVTRLDLKTGSLEKFNIENSKLSSNVIQFISNDSDNNIWIGTDGGGLYRYKFGAQKLLHLQANVENPLSLGGKAVYCMYESEPGMLWFGTYSSGINVWKKNKKNFFNITNEGETGKRLNSRSVIALYDDQNGELVLGMDGGGVNKFNTETNACTAYTEENSGLSGSIIKSIVKDHNDNFWCGTYGNGLCKINFKTGVSQKYVQDVGESDQTVDRNRIWSLAIIDHKLWIGPLKGGLNVYDFNLKKFIHHPFSGIKNFEPKDITTIMKDSKKRLWFATEVQGVYCYDSARGSYFNIVKQNGKQKFPSNDVRDIFEDSKGTMWFATQKGGLAKMLNFDSSAFITYTIKDGLPSNNIKKILEDSRGNLWISTDKGLSCFYVEKGLFRNFDIHDGLQGNEFNSSCGVKTKDGTMYFGGTEGLSFFHPDSIYYNLNQPKTVITDFKIFNQSIHSNKVYNNKIYLNKSITLAKEIFIDYEDYAFTIDFAALHYIAPLKNKYAYKLIGFDERWVHVGADKRFATYTNLDPGEYTFKVVACNNDGVWSTKGATLKIVITPPWWMNWIFRVLSIIFFISAFSLFFFLRQKSIQRQHRLLEEEVIRRTVELTEKNIEINVKSQILEENNYDISKTNDRILFQQEEILIQKDALELSNKTKDRFFSIIGHDLRNPVNALSFLVKQLMEESSKFEDTAYQQLMAEVHNSISGIQRLILNLLEWVRAQSDSVTIKPEIFEVFQLINEQISNLLPEAKSKNIAIIQNANQKIYAWADRQMMGTAIKNIISNSIKFSQLGGLIETNATTTNEFIIIYIKDHGIGMSEDTVKKLFKLEESFSTKGTQNELGSGLGLLIAHQFVILNKGDIIVESELGKGSTFTIKILSRSSTSLTI